MRVLYIFQIYLDKVLHQVYTLWTFSPSPWLVFSFTWLSAAEQKLLIFTKCILSIASHGSYLWYSLCESLYHPRFLQFSPVFYSRCFMVLVFTFRLFLPLELIFAYGAYGDPPSIELSLHICKQLSIYVWVYFWTPSHQSIFMSTPYYLDQYSFKITLEIS